MGVTDLDLQSHFAISTQNSKKRCSASLLYTDIGWPQGVTCPKCALVIKFFLLILITGEATKWKKEIQRWFRGNVQSFIFILFLICIFCHFLTLMQVIEIQHKADVKNNPWVTMNNIFGSRVKWFAKDFMSDEVTSENHCRDSPAQKMYVPKGHAAQIFMCLYAFLCAFLIKSIKVNKSLHI